MIILPTKDKGYVSFKSFGASWTEVRIAIEISISEERDITERKFINELTLYKKFISIVKPLHTTKFLERQQ